MKDYMEEAFQSLFNDVEQRTGKSMSDSQKQGIRNSGSLMFFEAMASGFHNAKTNDEVEKWLEEIDNFKR